MIEWEKLKELNEKMQTTDVKGKNYVEVNKRVMAFRELEPNGSITTEIVSLADGIVTMKATITDGNGQVLSTGLAYEKESSSFINKTSYIENCETSAVGRALGFCGIGIDGSIASAEEVANAITQQAAQKLATESEKKMLMQLCQHLGVNINEVLKEVGVKGKMTQEQHGKALRLLKDIEAAQQ